MGLQLEIVAAAGRPQTLDAREVVLPGAGGVFTVLPGHTPLLSTLTYGVIVATDEHGEGQFFAVHGGFCEVNQDRITVLAETVESEAEIDRQRAQAAAERARERLRTGEFGMNAARAEASLARALARLQAHQRESY